MHFTCRTIHRNICPQSVIINKFGTWKLCGLEFIERCNDNDIMVRGRPVEPEVIRQQFGTLEPTSEQKS
jgi:hypothetical protein